MRESKHTPGPWEEHPSQRGTIYSTVAQNENGEQVCVAYAHGLAGDWAKTHEEHEANARLIAAAPELLAACKKFVEVANYPLNDYLVELEGIINSAQAAIAKAESE